MTIKNFFDEIGNSSLLLTLALNLIMSYELSFEQKAKFKKSLIKNNPYNFDLNEVNPINFLSELFESESNEKITSWQVRVRIIELKHLSGSNETVYCVVQIGDSRYRTKEKTFDNLLFSDEDDEVS
jgi:hypothetical protein